MRLSRENEGVTWEFRVMMESFSLIRGGFFG